MLWPDQVLNSFPTCLSAFKTQFKGLKLPSLGVGFRDSLRNVVLLLLLLFVLTWHRVGELPCSPCPLSRQCRDLSMLLTATSSRNAVLLMLSRNWMIRWREVAYMKAKCDRIEIIDELAVNKRRGWASAKRDVHITIALAKEPFC